MHLNKCHHDYFIHVCILIWLFILFIFFVLTSIAPYETAFLSSKLIFRHELPRVLFMVNGDFRFRCWWVRYLIFTRECFRHFRGMTFFNDYLGRARPLLPKWHAGRPFHYIINKYKWLSCRNRSVNDMLLFSPLKAPHRGVPDLLYGIQSGQTFRPQVTLKNESLLYWGHTNFYY